MAATRFQSKHRLTGQRMAEPPAQGHPKTSQGQAPLPLAAACGGRSPSHLQSFRADLLPTEESFPSSNPRFLAFGSHSRKAESTVNFGKSLSLLCPWSDFSIPNTLGAGPRGGGHRHPCLFLGIPPAPLQTEDWENQHNPDPPIPHPALGWCLLACYWQSSGMCQVA